MFLRYEMGGGGRWRITDEVKRIKLQLWKIGDLRAIILSEEPGKVFTVQTVGSLATEVPRHRIYSDFHAEGRGCIYRDSFGLIQGNLLRLLSLSLPPRHLAAIETN